MPVALNILDAAFSKVVASLTLPFLDGLLDEYLFGGSAGATTPNRASPTHPLVPIGSPTYSTGYARFGSPDGSALNGFDTNRPCAETDMTFLKVIRKGGAANLAPMASSSSPQVGFGEDSGVWCAYNSQNVTATSLADLPKPDNTNFLFYAATLPLGAKATFYRFVSGVRSSNLAEVAGGLTRPSGDLILGFPTGGSVGLTDIAYLAKFNRILTTDEIDAAYASIKDYLAGRSISVS